MKVIAQVIYLEGYSHKTQIMFKGTSEFVTCVNVNPINDFVDNEPTESQPLMYSDVSVASITNLFDTMIDFGKQLD